MTDKIANATLDGARQNPFVRARAFVRDVISELKKVVWPTQRQLINYTIIVLDVISELKKVVWPTQRQLINYTIIVLVFVVIVALIIAALDFGFTQITLRIFGN